MSTAVRPPRPVQPVVAVIVTAAWTVSWLAVATTASRRGRSLPAKSSPASSLRTPRCARSKEETGLRSALGQVIGEREHPVTHRPEGDLPGCHADSRDECALWATSEELAKVQDGVGLVGARRATSRACSGRSLNT